METKNLLIRQIPGTLHRALKSIAALRGMTLTQLIIEILEEWENDDRQK